MGRRLISRAELAGVRAKLKRTEECIYDLNSEIVAFLRPPKGGFSKNQQKAAQEFLQHARRRQVIPPRFGVLVGEIMHHLRSILDHIVWLLSSSQYRLRHERAIMFPVCRLKPKGEKEISRYEGKVKGIASAGALELIEQLQPYNAADPFNHPLFIVNDFDRIDKHQTLVLIRTGFEMSYTVPFGDFIRKVNGMKWGQIKNEPTILAAAKNAKMQRSILCSVPRVWKKAKPACYPIVEASFARHC